MKRKSIRKYRARRRASDESVPYFGLFCLLTAIFLATALLVLVGTGPVLGGAEGQVLRDLRAWIAQVWSAGGARGIALGVALGAITTGLRVLLGADRPYGS